MLVLLAGVATLVGLTIHDYVGEQVHSTSTYFMYSSKNYNFPQQLSRTSVRSQVVMPPAFPQLSPVTGESSVFFSYKFHTVLSRPCAGSRPSSLRVSCETVHLPSALMKPTRRVFCSRNVESVCLVEGSVGCSSYVSSDGTFQNLVL
jgi:hypothetical protein